MKKDYLEALIVGAVVLLILTGSLFAVEMDKRIESSTQRYHVFSTYLKDDAVGIHSQEGAPPGVKSVDNRLRRPSGWFLIVNCQLSIVNC